MPLLNLDAGEDPSESEALWAQADVLCCACGGHAGDVASMARVARFCAERGRPGLGAHPSYPDREGFGRRSRAYDPAVLRASLVEQCSALAAVARTHEITVGWVKPHGALYHDAAKDATLAEIVVDAARAALGDVTLIGPPRGALRERAAARGVAYLSEGFADRRTRPDGSLVPRSEPDALIADPAECVTRARALVDDIDTICVHGDTPNAVAILAAVRVGVRGEALGDRAIRFPRPPTSARAIVREVRGWPGVVDVVVARDDVAVYLADEPVTMAARTRGHEVLEPARIAALVGAHDDASPGRELELDVVYDGADLDDVARATGLTRGEVVERHQRGIYTVETMGFAPGFAYLSGLDPRLELSRRATPRERVPAGAVAIAGQQTAVYPFESAGGWHLLGRVVGVRMFGASGALLALGDRVRFRS